MYHVKLLCLKNQSRTCLIKILAEKIAFFKTETESAFFEGQNNMSFIPNSTYLSTVFNHNNKDEPVVSQKLQFNVTLETSARSLMDKVAVFGTADVGSIPAGRTKTITTFFICAASETRTRVLTLAMSCSTPKP